MIFHLNIAGFLYGVVLFIVCTLIQINQPLTSLLVLGISLGVAIGVSNVLLSVIPRTMTPLSQMLRRDYIAASLFAVLVGISIGSFLRVPTYNALELNLIVFALAFLLPTVAKISNAKGQLWKKHS